MNSVPWPNFVGMKALEVARLGGKHDSAKPWKSEGPGVFEIVADDGDAYRAVYTVRFQRSYSRDTCVPEEINAGHKDSGPRNRNRDQAA